MKTLYIIYVYASEKEKKYSHLIDRLLNAQRSFQFLSVIILVQHQTRDDTSTRSAP